MKEFHLNPFSIGSHHASLKDAFHWVLNDESMIKAVHGNETIIGEWKKDPSNKHKMVRKIVTEFDFSTLSLESLKSYLSSTKAVVSIKQSVDNTSLHSSSSNHCVIKNKIKLKLFGGEFIKIRPKFILTHDTKHDTKHIDHTFTFQANVKASSFIPLPINDAIEMFIIQQSEDNLRTYERVLKEKLFKDNAHSSNQI
jgi:hypothetical protein